MPPVNAFLATGDIADERSWPLEVDWCATCLLVQLSTVVPPADLFRNYQHLSSASQSNARHLEHLAATLSDRLRLDGETRILEIGSNDGTLLAQFRSITRELLGVDAALNLAELARERGVETISEFMRGQLAKQIVQQRGRYDLVLALNVVAHTPDVNDLLRAARTVLAPGGTFVMEAVDVFQTLLQGEFDTVYHEHVYCFSFAAIRMLLERAGLSVVDVERIPTQGGSLRVFARHSEETAEPVQSVRALIDEEERRGVRQLETYSRIGQMAMRFRDEFRKELVLLKERHGRVIALGAPARGVVIANFCSISPEVVEAAIDDTPLKQGKLMPGVHIPVVSWNALEVAAPPSGYVLLSWNYEQEFLAKLTRFVSVAEMLIPLPRLRRRSIGSAPARAPVGA